MKDSRSSQQCPAFTLRFRNENTHRALRLTAKLLGISMNQLAEAVIERELTAIGVDLEERLTRTAELLRSLRSTDFREDVEAFAQAEVEVEDPLKSCLFEQEDKYEVGAAFARPLERG